MKLTVPLWFCVAIGMVHLGTLSAHAAYTEAAVSQGDLQATTVKLAYNDWGFLIAAAGSKDGYHPNLLLKIVRNGTPIGLAIVTEVEANQNVADILLDTLKPGESVKVGDVLCEIGVVNKPDPEPVALPGQKQGIQIVAVNREYGFFMIDRGTADGLRKEITFKVIRNGQQIARLRAVSVKDKATVVEEIEGTIKPGVRISLEDEIKPE